MSDPSGTFFTQVTPHGRSAIATLVITGPQAVEVVDHFFDSISKKPLSEFSPRRILFGKWNLSSGVAEDLVVAQLTEEHVEVHCHGGIAVVAAIRECLLTHGCKEKPWEQLAEDPCSEYTATAWKMVPMTTTRITGQIALHHATGEIDRLVTQVRTLADQGDLTAAAECLKPYLGTFALGEHVTKPFVVVLAGRPNAGKSSLLNACAGFGRAIIHAQAGTTRDVLQHDTVLAGWPVTILDTAGLRDGAAKLEQLGIDKAQQALQQADLVLWIHDATQPWEAETAEAQAVLAEIDHLWVVNKTDLQSPEDDLNHHIAVSARTGFGIPELLDAVIEKLAPGAAVAACPELGHPYVLLTQAMDDQFWQWHQTLQAGHIPRF